MLTNTGNTPAHHVMYHACAKVLPVPLPDDFAFPLPDVMNGNWVLGPHQNFTINATVEDFAAEEDAVKIKAGRDKAVYIWGLIKYVDAFGEIRQTKFCHYIYWDLNNVVWGFYNSRHNEAT